MHTEPGTGLQRDGVRGHMTPHEAAAMGAQAGANYHFISCFTPGGATG